MIGSFVSGYNKKRTLMSLVILRNYRSLKMLEWRFLLILGAYPSLSFRASSVVMGSNHGMCRNVIPSSPN